jgi:hypothetical protein
MPYRSITLKRDGQPFTIGELEEGAEIIYEVVSGEIILIKDKDGGTVWQREMDMIGKKIGRMVATMREKKDG